MQGFAASRHAETIQRMTCAGEPRENRTRAIEQASVIAPRAYDQRCSAGDAVDHRVVVWANWIHNGAQHMRFDAAIGEQIDQHERIEAPPLRVADAAPRRRIVVGRIRCRRVQTNEDTDGRRCAPMAPQQIAVTRIVAGQFAPENFSFSRGRRPSTNSGGNVSSWPSPGSFGFE